MFDVSWGEMLMIGAAALIVIGPKELPAALRTLGQTTAKLRRMAGEFRAQFDQAMREAELDSVKKDIEGLNTKLGEATSTFNPIETIRNEIKGAMDKAETPPPPAPAADLPVPIEPASPVPEPVAAAPETPAPPAEPPAAPAFTPIEPPAAPKGGAA